MLAAYCETLVGKCPHNPHINKDNLDSTLCISHTYQLRSGLTSAWSGLLILMKRLVLILMGNALGTERYMHGL